MAKNSMTVRLEQDLIDRIDALAERVGLTRTDVVERCVRAGLEEGESLANKLENPLIRAMLEATLALDASISPEDKEGVRKATESIKAAAAARKKSRRTKR